MAAAERTVLRLPRGYRSAEAGSFVAQLDTLSALMAADLRGIRPAELAWQPAPGMNSIGMLLAHIAIVEVWWTESGIRGVPIPGIRFEPILGLGRDDDGIPLPPRGRPPAGLAGRSLPFFTRALDRARRHLRRVARTLTDAEVGAVRRRIRRDGATHVYNVRWVLHHQLEHLAGHYGQVLLLRHAFAARRSRR